MRQPHDLTMTQDDNGQRADARKQKSVLGVETAATTSPEKAILSIKRGEGSGFGKHRGPSEQSGQVVSRLNRRPFCEPVAAPERDGAGETIDGQHSRSKAE